MAIRPSIDTTMTDNLLTNLDEPEIMLNSANIMRTCEKSLINLDEKLLHNRRKSQSLNDITTTMATMKAISANEAAAADTNDNEARKKRTSLGGSSYQRTESESSNELIETTNLPGESPKLSMVHNEFEYLKKEESTVLKKEHSIEIANDFSMIGKSNEDTIIMLQQLIQRRSQLKEMDRQLFALISRCLAKLDSEETRAKLINWLPLQSGQLTSPNELALSEELIKTISPQTSTPTRSTTATATPPKTIPTTTRTIHVESSHQTTPFDETIKDTNYLPEIEATSTVSKKKLTIPTIITTTASTSTSEPPTTITTTKLSDEHDKIVDKNVCLNKRKERAVDLSLTIPSGLTYNQLVGDDKLSSPSTSSTSNPLNCWLRQLHPPSTPLTADLEPLERRPSTNSSIFNFRKSRLLDGINLNLLNFEKIPSESSCNDLVISNIDNDNKKETIISETQSICADNKGLKRHTDEENKVANLGELDLKRAKMDHIGQLSVINNSFSINNQINWLNYHNYHNNNHHNNNNNNQHHYHYNQVHNQQQHNNQHSNNLNRQFFDDKTTREHMRNQEEEEQQKQHRRDIQTSHSAPITSQTLNLNQYFMQYNHNGELSDHYRLKPVNQTSQNGQSDYMLPLFSNAQNNDKLINNRQLASQTSLHAYHNSNFLTAQHQHQQQQQYQLHLPKTNHTSLNNLYNPKTPTTATSTNTTSNLFGDLLLEATNNHSLFSHSNSMHSRAHSDLRLALKHQEAQTSIATTSSLNSNLAQNGLNEINQELLARLGCDHQKLLAHQCHVCGSGFEDRHRLQQHLSIHLNLHPSWFEEQTIKETMDQYESKRGDYLCKICSIRFETTAEFDKHMQVHGEKPHKCDLCLSDSKNVSFRFYRQLLTHLRSHCFLYCCRFVPNCKQKANRKDYLKLHILKHHLNNKLPECYTICCH